tara:strand:- start:403 stop:999 length:597 start_codon:yes stop_codon:yes gene_type:complete
MQIFRLNIRKKLSKWFEDPLVSLLVSLKISPSVITSIGLLVAILAGYFCLLGNFLYAGLLVLFSSLFDLLDGGVARKTGKTSSQGAMLDSVFDRFSEVLVLLGLSVYFINNGENLMIILSFVALSGSLMVSYIRARAESLGVSGTSGLFTRPERVIIVVICLLINLPNFAVWILAIGTPISALHRLIASLISIKRNQK